ncbi:hypothetical protein [Campylobacter concisus]|nr:hypothetical protein [Campylobacter concisus]
MKGKVLSLNLMVEKFHGSHLQQQLKMVAEMKAVPYKAKVQVA